MIKRSCGNEIEVSRSSSMLSGNEIGRSGDMGGA